MDDPEIIGPVAYRFPGTHSDVYTLGVVIREFAQLATSRYPASAEALLERGLREGWGWEYYPYSEELMTLIQDCTQLDGRNRPPIYDVYRRTKEWSEFMAQRLEAMDQQAQAEYSDRYFTRATVLWTRAQQEEYRHSESFRDAYFRATDWFYLNQGKYEDLCEVAVNPRPAPLGYVAIGNGLKFERIQPPPIARRVQRVRGEDPRETQPTKSAYNQGFRESIHLGGTAIQGGRKGRGLTGRVVRSIFKMFKRRER